MNQSKSETGKGLWGSCLLALFLIAVLSPILAAFAIAGKEGRLVHAFSQVLAEASTRRALVFGLKQAALSSLVALVIGLPGAWLTARFRFPGKSVLKALSAIPFCVPPVLVVLSFVLYYGRAGFLNRVLMGAFGLSEPPLSFLFSLAGLVLVHGFYNFPIILQNVGDAWARIPRDREEAARSLGAGPLRAFAVGTLPSLIPSLIQALSLVFLFCFFSFIVVLVFGPLGGSTLEVEIYRASRLDANQSKAAVLSIIETLLALGVVFLFQTANAKNAIASKKAANEAGMRRPRGFALLALLAYALFLAVFFLGPLAALLVQAFSLHQGGVESLGLGNFERLLSGSSPLLLRALGDSLKSALPAALLSTISGCILAFALRQRGGRKGFEAVLSLPLAVSSVVMALGWSFLFPQGGKWLISLVLALSSLPFAIRSLSASLDSLPNKPRAAARTLGASRLRAALEIELPAMLPAILSTAAFSFSLAAGDANIPLLLGGGSFEPLPLLIYRLVGAYRFPEACAAGLVLALLSGFIFLIKDLRYART